MKKILYALLAISIIGGVSFGLSQSNFLKGRATVDPLSTPAIESPTKTIQVSFEDEGMAGLTGSPSVTIGENYTTACTESNTTDLLFTCLVLGQPDQYKIWTGSTSIAVTGSWGDESHVDHTLVWSDFAWSMTVLDRATEEPINDASIEFNYQIYAGTPSELTTVGGTCYSNEVTQLSNQEDGDYLCFITLSEGLAEFPPTFVVGAEDYETVSGTFETTRTSIYDPMANQVVLLDSTIVFSDSTHELACNAADFTVSNYTIPSNTGSSTRHQFYVDLTVVEQLIALQTAPNWIKRSFAQKNNIDPRIQLSTDSGDTLTFTIQSNGDGNPCITRVNRTLLTRN